MNLFRELCKLTLMQHRRHWVSPTAAGAQGNGMTA